MALLFWDGNGAKVLFNKKLGETEITREKRKKNFLSVKCFKGNFHGGPFGLSRRDKKVGGN